MISMLCPFDKFLYSPCRFLLCSLQLGEMVKKRITIQKLEMNTEL